MKDWERAVLVVILLLVVLLVRDSLNIRWKIANGQITVRCQQ